VRKGGREESVGALQSRERWWRRWKECERDGMGGREGEVMEGKEGELSPFSPIVGAARASETRDQEHPVIPPTLP